MSILITLLIIAVLVLVHEWGHFIVARRVGIPIHEFALGFGYKLFSIKRNGVEYSLRLIPLGGFVRMAGEELDDLNESQGYSSRTPLEKIRVAFAGPFMNFVLAILIFIYIFAFIGIPHSSNEAVLGKVMEDKPAYAAGLRENDEILEVEGAKVTNWHEFTEQIGQIEAGQNLEMIISRDGQQQTIIVAPEYNSTTGQTAIGVLNKIKYERQGIITSIKLGLEQTYELTVLLLGGLWTLVSGGAGVNDLAGPVGITKLVGEAADIGFVFLLNFAAFLSINLGILNLLPIPALDGSKIMFATIEAVRRKPIEPEKEGLFNWIGFMFLLLLIVVVTYNDILRLFKG
ncbi:MAG TPA: RIP metalloprotease RseP [Syntrophomonadaceae bacterium]|nr:RIP metalloprotease RseP [Syntrophomonadaceae bacterium]